MTTRGDGRQRPKLTTINASCTHTSPQSCPWPVGSSKASGTSRGQHGSAWLPWQALSWARAALDAGVSPTAPDELPDGSQNRPPAAHMTHAGFPGVAEPLGAAASTDTQASREKPRQKSAQRNSEAQGATPGLLCSSSHRRGCRGEVRSPCLTVYGLHVYRVDHNSLAPDMTQQAGG